MAETVTASLATIPSREWILKLVVGRLLPQVDVLNVFLNGWSQVPRCLAHPKVCIARSQDLEDRGDAGKAWWASDVQGYHFFCDDDWVYPEDHVAKTIEGIELYERKAVIGWQGSIIQDAFEHYYAGLYSRLIVEANGVVPYDIQVHILSTGLCGYHTSTIKVRHEDFQAANMADVWFAVLGKQQSVPFVVLGHEACRFPTAPPGDDPGIFEHGKADLPGPKNTRDRQTQVVRANMPWPKLPVMPVVQVVTGG